LLLFEVVSAINSHASLYCLLPLLISYSRDQVIGIHNIINNLEGGFF